MLSADQLVFDILFRAWIVHDKNKLHRTYLKKEKLIKVNDDAG
jgi:hypothetical protein